MAEGWNLCIWLYSTSCVRMCRCGVHIPYVSYVTVQWMLRPLSFVSLFVLCVFT